MQKVAGVRPVSLSVPAEPGFARSVRMLAANLAVLAGLSFDDVEDVRMASEEGFVWCCATGAPACEIVFDVADGRISMSFVLGHAELPKDDQTSAYAELIFTAVCDECIIDRDAGLLRLTKSVDSVNG